MELARLGRVVAVALLALLTPVACAALGVGTPGASGLPSSPGSASPAVQQGDDEEASTAVTTDKSTTDEALLTIVRRTGLWAVPASQLAQRRANNAEPKVLGRELAGDLRELDGEAAAIAGRLELNLPGREVRAFASTDSDVVDRFLTDLADTGLVTGSASPEPTRQGSTTETAQGSASSTSETTPVASTSTTDGGGAQAGLIAWSASPRSA
jgi:hypothetical protein